MGAKRNRGQLPAAVEGCACSFGARETPRGTRTADAANGFATLTHQVRHTLQGLRRLVCVLTARLSLHALFGYASAHPFAGTPL